MIARFGCTLTNGTEVPLFQEFMPPGVLAKPSAPGAKEMANLLIHLGRVGHSLGNRFTEDLAKALAQSMQRYPQGPFVHPQAGNVAGLLASGDWRRAGLSGRTPYSRFGQIPALSGLWVNPPTARDTRHGVHRPHLPPRAWSLTGPPAASTPPGHRLGSAPSTCGGSGRKG